MATWDISQESYVELNVQQLTMALKDRLPERRIAL